MRQDGVMLANNFINPGALVDLGAVIAEGARTAEQLPRA